MGRKARKPPLVADPQAMRKVRAAADAAEVSVEELCDLMVDSGVMSAPPKDGITQSYTLADLGNRLWAVMNAVRVSKRPEWFADLTPVQQAALIVQWRNHGFSTEFIASQLQLDAREVRKTYDKHSDDVGAQVVGVRLSTIAGQMQLTAEQVSQAAWQEGDYRTAWRVEKDRVAMLQDLGIVDKAIHKVEVSHKIDGTTEAEIKKLVELEQRRAARIEEIKRVDAEVYDRVPDMPNLEAEK